MIQYRSAASPSVVFDHFTARAAVRWRGRGQDVSFFLPGARSTPGTARAIARYWMVEWQVPAGVRADAELIVSELAANTVLHTTSRVIEFRLHLRDRWLMINVVDQGPRRPVRLIDHVAESDVGKPLLADEAPGAEEIADSGRGLLIVDRLAEKWGANPLRGGTLAWARLTIPASPAELWDR
ncbi:ATP-binding protein [Streptomyces sp. 184]|uniref:ATP-binding protein n=1 Tax=Streptomyces sp. 184 TaxID=1827526 RepID=UPI003892634D